MTKAQCKAKRTDGQPCGMKPGQDGYCWNHRPGIAKARAEARMHGGRARHTPHAGNSYNLPPDFLSVADARKILDYVLAELLPMDNSIARARALLAVHDSYIKSFEIGGLQDRIEALENALKARS